MDRIGPGGDVSAQPELLTNCSRPYKPFEFTRQYELDSFKRQVESYERCIDDFVREQREAAKKHRDAAKDAIEEWNSFVRTLR